jgi:predicted RNA-binding Zn-ribbon protein involved in translation (DUF1610 family)
MGYYAVCTQCDFLRVLGEHARGLEFPERCPKCEAELIVREKNARFEPAYVGRVARSIQRARL